MQGVCPGEGRGEVALACRLSKRAESARLDISPKEAAVLALGVGSEIKVAWADVPPRV